MALRCSLSDWETNKNDFEHVIHDPHNWNQIPLINTIPNYELHDHQLVRFRGMVQYMYNPEYFMAQYEVEDNSSKVKVTRSGRYRDVIQCAPNEKVVENRDQSIEERQVFYCITTPALNDWVYQQEKKLGLQQQETESVASKVCDATTKRQIEDEPMDTDHLNQEASSLPQISTSSATAQEPKRFFAGNSMNNSGSSACHGLSLNFPIDGSHGIACLVKINDSDSLPSLKINDIIDVVGFLSLDPSLAHVPSSMGTEAENLAENPPPSIVPRLHAVTLQKVTHVNLLPNNLDDIYKTALKTKKELHFVLTQMLLGDSLAADYLICHLISLVYMRKDGLALGHFSLNLSNLPQRPDYTRLLYSVLERLLPKSHYLPMTLENMNTLSFSPKMDYEANRLSSGLLQLSDNTHLIVDETRLEAGKLDASGVVNVQALRTLITHQIVNYDFQYYSKPYDADVPVLILSEGKSLLPCNMLVSLNADPSCLNTLPEIFQAANHFLREPLLTEIRLYLSVMRHSDYEFPEDLQKQAQEDFVQMRQTGGQNVSAEDLHLLLVLARLVSLSNGEKTVSLDAWEKAKRMEAERKSRIDIQRSRAAQPANEP